MSRASITDLDSSVPAGCISGLELERFFCGELERLQPERAAEVQRHLGTCADCQARHGVLEQARAEFLTQFSLPALSADLQRRLELSSASQTQARKALEPAATATGSLWERIRTFWQGLGTPGVLRPVWAGALAMALLAVMLPHRIPPTQEYLGEKSALRVPGPLEVYVLRNGVVQPAQEGQSFKAGDRLQFLVKPGSYRYLQLVSLDSSGHLTAFFPAEGQESMALSVDGEQLLPESIELDGFQGLERIFAVFTEAPIPWSVVQSAADRAVLAGPAAGKSLGGRVEAVDLRVVQQLPISGAAQVSFLMVKP